jgi:hypothetical protein
VARRSVAPEHREVAIIRLQLELKLDRKAAEAAVLAGYLSAAEIAAAADEEFHEAVRLPLKRRVELLGQARKPGSKAPEPGPAPASMREPPLRPVLVRAVAPVRKTVTKLLGEAPAPPSPRAPGPRPAPPHADADAPRKRAHRRSAEDIEAAVDEELAKGS